MNGSAVDIIPVGGVGQFGMNSLLLRSGEDVVVIDAGLMFPTGELYGIDVIVPDLTPLLEDARLLGIVLTHGHEDHVGAAPWLMDRTSCPVYGSDLTVAIVRERIRSRPRHDPAAETRLVTVRGRDRVRAGPFDIEFLDVTHSIPGAFALAIDTPAGTIVHSADFKLDATPVEGPPTDLERLAERGREGVRLLLLDSTNAGREGATPSERVVGRAFAQLFGAGRRRVLVTTFSSHVARIQQIADLATATGRRLALVGRRMSGSMRLARETGRLRAPAGLFVTPTEAMDLPPGECVIVAGGSQGEPFSAMSRIARGEHPEVGISPGDVVVHSSRAIPGNEAALGRVLDDLARRGAEVLDGDRDGFHVSGHGAREDLRAWIALTRPETVVPVHGNYRNLVETARLSESVPDPPRTVLLAENGDIIHLDPVRARITGRLDTRRIFLDREHDAVEEEILRERRRVAEEGLILPVLVLDRASGRLMATPQIVARGFVAPSGDPGLLGEAARLAAEAARGPWRDMPGGGTAALEETVREEVRRFVRRRTNKKPLVIPVVIEI